MIAYRRSLIFPYGDGEFATHVVFIYSIESLIPNAPRSKPGSQVPIFLEELKYEGEEDSGWYVRG
jgi:hypothetical protein